KGRGDGGAGKCRNRSLAVTFKIGDGSDEILTDRKCAGQTKHGMENEFARRNGELSVEGARAARYQLELSIIDNNALLFRKLARAFHDHPFSRCARNLASTLPV